MIRPRMPGNFFVWGEGTKKKRGWECICGGRRLMGIVSPPQFGFKEVLHRSINLIENQQVCLRAESV